MALNRIGQPRMQAPGPRYAPSPEAAVGYAVAALCLGLAVAWLFRGFWSAQVFLAGSDTYSHDYPFWRWGWGQVFALGRVPQFNPWLFGGWPFVSTFAFCPWYPGSWLSAPLPTALALTLQYAGHLWWGGLGFYFFCRSLRLGLPQAWMGALFYLAACHDISLAFPGHLSKVQAIAWLPWAAGAAQMLYRTGRLRWALLLGLAGAAQALASHAQVAWCTALWVLAYLTAMALWGRESAGRRASMLLRCAGGLIVAGLLAGALSAVQMLPSMREAAHSNRAGGLPYAESVEGSMPPEALLDIVLPSFRGDSTGRTWRLEGSGHVLPYLGRWHSDFETETGGQRLVSDYIGMAPLSMLFFALVFAPDRKKWIFLALAVAGGLLALGQFGPFHRWAHALLPGFDHFRSPGTNMLLAHFSLMALAALGLAGFWWRVGRWSPGLRNRLALGLLLGGLAALLVGARMDTVLRGSMEQALEQARSNADSRQVLGELFRAKLGYLSLARSLRFLGAVSMLLAALIALGRQPYHTEKVWRLLAQAGLGLALVLVALADAGGHARNFLPQGRRADIEAYLDAHPVDRLVLADAEQRREPLPGLHQWGAEFSNRGLASGIRSIFGYHPIVPEAYEKLIDRSGGYDAPRLKDLFAINYQWLPAGQAPPEGWERLAELRGRTLVRRATPLPFAALPRRLVPDFGMFGMPDEATASEAQQQGPAQGVFAIAGDTGWQLPDRYLDGEDSPPSVRLEMPAPDRFRLRLTAPLQDAQRDLVPAVVALPAHPGWRLRVGDRAFGRYSGWPGRAEGYLLIVPLDVLALEDTELRFVAPGQVHGQALTGGAILLLLLLAGLRWKMGPRYQERLLLALQRRIGRR